MHAGCRTLANTVVNIMLRLRMSYIVSNVLLVVTVKIVLSIASL